MYGLPSEYAEVSAVEGAWLVEEKDAPTNTSKCATNKMHIDSDWSNALLFASKYFQKGKIKRLRHRKVLCAVTPDSASSGHFTAQNNTVPMVGSASGQYLCTDLAPVVTCERASLAYSLHTAVTTRASSMALSNTVAVAESGGAEGRFAIGGSYARAYKDGVAVVTKAGGLACGDLGSWLIFYAEGQTTQAFRVDGKKVLPDKLYTLQRGCLCEVEPWKDLPEGEL